MIQVQCPGCLAQVFLECTCPPGYPAASGAHQAGCTHGNIDAMVRCPDPAASGCCPEPHDHGAAGNACPGNHDGAPCPEPVTCRTWKSQNADAFHPAYDGPAPGPCPGGHCHKDTDGCTVCRPLIITVLPGTELVPAFLGAPAPVPLVPAAGG